MAFSLHLSSDPLLHCLSPHPACKNAKQDDEDDAANENKYPVARREFSPSMVLLQRFDATVVSIPGERHALMP